MSNLPWPARVLLEWAGCSIGVISVIVTAGAVVGFPYPDQWNDGVRFGVCFTGLLFGGVVSTAPKSLRS